MHGGAPKHVEKKVGELRLTTPYAAPLRRKGGQKGKRVRVEKWLDSPSSLLSQVGGAPEDHPSRWSP